MPNEFCRGPPARFPLAGRIGSCLGGANPVQRGATPVQWALPIVCVLAAGCSLPTLPAGNAQADQQIGGGIVRIAVPKSGLADCASADECTLVRAAEAAQRAGGTHFMVLPGHGGSTQKGFAYIKVFTFGDGEAAPGSAMSVEEALYFFRRPAPGGAT